MANFASLGFIFRFLPIFFLVYYFVAPKYKNIVALVGSLAFYALGEPVYLALLILLTGVNFYFSNLSFRARKSTSKKQKRSKIYMIVIVCLDIAVLMTFKALTFLATDILFPIGLSFYIFKMLSFQIDVYTRKIANGPSLIETATYFTLFAQIAQGPIMRYSDGEFSSHKKITLSDIESGFVYFAIGLGMKVLLADRIGILWNDIKMYGYESISTPLAWLGAFAYSFELYFDFWGYSLMASGIMVAMGYSFIENFNHPYSSKSISEFYRRWHVTLGNFFKDYLYIPLGGNRSGKFKTALNLMIVWLITGIWHGNGLNFILWGVVLGILVILEKFVWGKFLSEHGIVGNVYVIFIIPLTWVIFAIDNFKDMGMFFQRLFPFFGTASIVDSSDIWQYLGDYWWLFVLSIVLCIPKIAELFDKYKKKLPVLIGLFLLFWYSVYFCAVSEGNPFMYLNF